MGQPLSMNRVSVVGTTGSGKTTFAAKLGEALAIPHVELDALNWSSNWTPASPEVFRSRVKDVADAERWVIDGNYSAARDLVWGRADTIIWLNYSLRVTLSRLLRRTARRIVLGESCCNGNRESLSKALSRDSIIWWALRSYRRRRREYPRLLKAREAAGTWVVKLRSPKEAEKWLARVGVSVELIPH